MQLAARQKRPAEDGIVPLINIVFLLLIFFLIVGTIAPSADIEVDYPETEQSPVSRAPSDALYVSAGGYLSYRGEALAMDDVAAVVAATRALGLIDASSGAVAEEPLPVVVDRSLPARDLGPVLGALAASGVGSVRLITLRARKPAGGGS